MNSTSFALWGVETVRSNAVHFILEVYFILDLCLNRMKDEAHLNNIYKSVPEAEFIH
jgi:hypothetical protein